MKLTVENEALVKALAFVQGSISATTTMPILEHVVLDAAEGRLRIRACDLSREAEASIPATVPVPGSAAVPGEVLASLVKKLLRKSQTKFDLANNGRLSMESAASRYQLRALNSADFPSLKPRDDAEAGIATFNVHAHTLKGALKEASMAALEGHPHFYSRGVHLHIEGKALVAVATDDHRLIRVEMPMPAGASGMPAVTIPLKAVAELGRLLALAEDPEVQLTVRESMIEIKVGMHVMRSMLLACTYPPYHRIYPPAGGKEFSFRPYALKEAIDRAILVYAREKQEAAAPVVQFVVGGDKLTVLAGGAANETAEEEIECTSNGAEVGWAMNARYVLQMLSTMPEDSEASVMYTKLGTPVRFLCTKRPEILHLISQAKLIRRGVQKQQGAENAAA